MPLPDLREIVGGEPTWEIVQLFPAQGMWSDEQYLSLKTNRLVELSDGRLEFPPMPSEEHQDIVALLYRLLFDFVTARSLGKVLFAPLRVRLWQGKYREPDLVFMLAEHADRRTNQYWIGADLAVEIVSEDDPDRDWVDKRREYAVAGIQEYWIVDPRDETITLLALNAAEQRFELSGTFSPGDAFKSMLLADFVMMVDDVFGQD